MLFLITTQTKKMNHRGFFILICTIAIAACTRDRKQVAPAYQGPLFTSVPAEHSGIAFKNSVVQTDSFNCVNYTYALLGGGVAVGDLNNDGWEDLYFTSNQKSNKLYLNKGDFKFEDDTAAAGVSDSTGWSTGVSMVDINNDGWLDLYVCKSASIEDREGRKNKLFINLKNGTFKEQAKDWGLDHPGFSIQSYFLDYDKDGDLDLYLVNHRVDFENTLRIEKRENQKFYPETSDHLFRNDGHRFTNVTPQAGLVNKAWGLSAAIGDFNNDGWPDIYVANDYIAPDHLYINNRNGTFSDQIDTRLKHISYNSMGADFSDINNDLLPDLMVLEMSAEDHVRSKENMPTMNTAGFQKIVSSGYHYPYMANMLQLNNGNGSFTEIGQMAGVSKTDWSWGPLIADFDNDGYKDLFISNGIERNFSNQDYIRTVQKNLERNIVMTVSEVIDMMPSEKLVNYGFRNKGNLQFENTTQAWGLTDQINTNGVAYSDLDNDGDLDLVLSNMSDTATLYKNHSQANYLDIVLKGPPGNTTAIGATVTLFTRDGKQRQELYTNRGYQSAVTKVVHFGLSETETADRVEVIWSDGKVSTLSNIAANQRLQFEYDPDSEARHTRQKVTRNVQVLSPKKSGIGFEHKENGFDDFSRQTLLPRKYSQQGPTLSVGDINGDGLDDFFIGGAHGQTGAFYLQNRHGHFDSLPQSSFERDRSYEDQGSLLFDADQDGDLDLYVCSGGYELEEQSNLLQDRLYLNQGNGTFTRSLRLPTMLSNTKAVKAIDSDNDGDKDLVIGGQTIPGKYPLSAPSYFLENSEGAFTIVTEQLGPDFAHVGIVNDLLFSDYDDDGDADLFVVGEWMALTVFENQDNVYEPAKIEAFENTEGWWNSIAAVDLDKDGDLDYLFGNLGKNNKFQPTKEKPLHIFGADFDDNGRYDMVLSKSYQEKLVPIRGKECSTEQNSFIAETIPTFKQFAQSSLADIYGKEALAHADHWQATHFGSAYALNLGNGQFQLKELPSSAQMGPSLSFAIADINQDGYEDVIGVGAIHESEVETIRYDGNIGYILTSGAEGQMTPYKDVNLYLGKNAKVIQKIQIGKQTHFLIGNNNTGLNLIRAF